MKFRIVIEKEGHTLEASEEDLVGTLKSLDEDGRKWVVVKA